MRRIIFLIVIFSFGLINSLYPCSNPILFKADSVSASSVWLSWFNFDSEVTAFEIDYVEGSGNPSDFPLYSNITDQEFVLSGLNPGTQYTLYLRAVCDNGKSKWVNLKVRTAFKADNPCTISFPIQDNNCRFSGRERMLIEVDSNDISHIEGAMLSSVSMIVEHAWPPDLRATLIAPSGRTIPLFEGLALGHQNLGNPEDESCIETLTFQDNSCIYIQDSPGPFIGEFRPIGLLSSVPVNELIGMWQLDICDASPGDAGTVISLNLTFSSGNCQAISHELYSYDNESVSFNILNGNIGDTIVYKYGVHPFSFSGTGISDTFIINSITDTLITIGNLIEDTEYDFYAYRKCKAVNSAVSCAETIHTFCGLPTDIAHFNDEDFMALAQCGDPGLLDGVWYQEDHYGWKVNYGATRTDFTGPNSSPYGNNQYIYFDASDFSCGAIPAVLKSSCFYVPDSIQACGISFDYSMDGNEVSNLILRIMANESGEWDTLFHVSGDQGDDWLQARIDLSDYADMAVNLEFIAGPSIGARGDIALDNITMMGPLPIHRNGYLLYVDNDGDGYGITEESTRFCRSGYIEGYSEIPGDCDDDNPDVNPGAEEIPCNLIDDNCNGLIDEVPVDNPPHIAIIEKQNPSCKGISDGILEIDVSNYMDFHILWNTGDTSTRLENLPEGVYYAELTTPNGCLFMTAFYELKSNSNITAIVTTQGSPLCKGIDDGYIGVQAGAGIEPYSFRWNTGEETDFIDSLSAGVYSVTVSDAEGCIKIIESIELVESFIDKAQIDINKDISCQGASNGSLIASLHGAQPHTYLWSTGETTRAINNLSEGYYSVTMTFLEECTISTDSFFFAEPKPLHLRRLNIISPTCADQKGGSIVTNVGGGKQPYTYRLHGIDSIYPGPLFLDLPAGMYRLEIHDANNCTFILDSIELKEISPFEMDYSVKDTRCPLSSDGSIETNFSGGTAPYNYVWSSTGLGTSYLDGLNPGQYSLTVVDDFGCKSDKYTFQVTRGADNLEMDISVLDPVYCGDSTGYLEAVILNDFDFPLEYNWNNGTVHKHESGRDTLGPVRVGNYRVTVTDANGCVGNTDLIRLNQLENLFIDSILISHPECVGDSTGSIEFIIPHYSSPLNFSWSDGSSNPILKNAPIGTYAVTISDAEDCKHEESSMKLFVDNPLAAEHLLIKENDDNYTVEVIPEGGEAPYSIIWLDDMSTDFRRHNLPKGDYSYSLTDNNSCVLDSTVQILKVDIIFAEDKGFSIYPNPANDLLNIELAVSLQGREYALNLYSASGIYIQSWVNAEKIDISALVPGVYYLELISNGLTYRQKVIKN